MGQKFFTPYKKHIFFLVTSLCITFLLTYLMSLLQYIYICYLIGVDVYSVYILGIFPAEQLRVSTTFLHLELSLLQSQNVLNLN